jgi:hypothetical protein
MGRLGEPSDIARQSTLRTCGDPCCTSAAIVMPVMPLVELVRMYGDRRSGLEIRLVP